MERRTGEAEGCVRVVGGYRLIRVVDLCRAWHSYRTGRIRLLDLRVWFACHELLARRCVLEDGRQARYSLAELHRLVGGVGGEHLRNSLKRLSRCELLRWSETALDCTPSPAPHHAGLETMLLLVGSHRRLVPVPRRVLRVLAAAGGRVLIATVLGHLCRCLYFRAGRCRPVGACKASWIAAVFGVDERNVKAARKRLVALGWLTALDCCQWYKNRFGPRVRVNLEWGREPGARAGARAPSTTSSPPPRALSTSRTPPPESDKEPPPGYRNQKPACRGPAGDRGREAARGRGAPTLANVLAEDLSDTGRLLELFRQAVRAGLVRRSEHDRLQFVAAAEPASAAGVRNPAGLFVHLVRRRLWQYLTLADEEAARRRLKRRCEARGLGVKGGCPGSARAHGTSVPAGLADCARAILESWSLRKHSSAWPGGAAPGGGHFPRLAGLTGARGGRHKPSSGSTDRSLSSRPPASC